jgi:hypothetical protein
MQPNNQQGYYRPEATQPIQPISPPPAQAPVVDTAALQAALNEPAPQQPAPVQAPAPAPLPQPQVAPQQSAPSLLAQQPVRQQQPYQDESPEEVSQDAEEPVVWSAQEFLHQEKGSTWFAIFGVVAAALIGLSIWTQAWTFTVLVIVIAVLIVVYSRRPPRDLTYSLTEEGLLVDGKLHTFDGFKAFGIVRDGEHFSVMLIPTQRFQPGVSVYFPEEAGEAIVDMLGSRLPMKDLKLDAVDKLVRLLRL